MAATEAKGWRIPRALICDALVVLANLLGADAVRRRLEAGVKSFHENDTTAPPLLGIILGASFVLYSAGCWLKRGPLHSRSFEGTGATGCLLVAWVALMLSLTILGATVVMVEAEGDAESGWQMVLMFAIALLPVILGLRAMVAGNVEKLPRWRRHAVIEILADLLLVAAILPVTLLWQGWISGVFSQNLSDAGFGMRLFAAALTTIAFAVFYAAPRLPLAWDRMRDRWTWISLGFAATPTLYHCLFP